MNYKTTFFEKMNLFPQNIQDNWPKSIGLARSCGSGKDTELIKYTIIFQYQTAIDMLDFAKGNETTTTTVGILVTGELYIRELLINYDKELTTELDDLFTHGLQLPAWHTGYPSQALLVEDITKRLNKAIKIVSEMN